MFVLLLSLAGPEEAPAQRWLQTAELEVPVHELGAYQRGPLLDTLTQVLSRRDSLTVRRSPLQEARLGVDELKKRLRDRPGIEIDSASHMRITYRFEVHNRHFEETIESIFFLYRSRRGQNVIPILYGERREPWMREILQNEGWLTGRHTNTTVDMEYLSFADMMAFARIHADGRILKIAGEDVRDGSEKKKRQLTRKILRLTYESM